jgi:hypothetical protein
VTRISLALAVALAATPSLVAANIVNEGEFIRQCRQEASVKLGRSHARIMMLPTEVVDGKVVINGQTDEADPTLFECMFDKERRLIDVKVHAPHASGKGHGASRRAVDKCVATMGPNTKVEKVSDFGNGFSEVIMRDTGNGLHVACTAPNDGGNVADWIELKR